MNNLVDRFLHYTSFDIQSDFPDMLLHKGEDFIVADGTTLLGADDKAGIAESGIQIGTEWL